MKYAWILARPEELPAKLTALIELAWFSVLLTSKLPPCGAVILTVVRISFLRPGKFLESIVWSLTVNSRYLIVGSRVSST